MYKKALSFLLAALLVLSIIAMFPRSAAAEGPPAVVFSDGDLDRVYFHNDTITFNLTGLPVGAPEGLPEGTVLRVAFGIVNTDEVFSDFTLFDGLSNGMGDGTGWYLERTLTADGTTSASSEDPPSPFGGTFDTDVPPIGTVAVKLYAQTGPTTWVNIMQEPNYIPLIADGKPATVGLDNVMEMPDGVTSVPILGSGAQNAEDLRNLNISFSKVIGDGITGSITFTGLSLLDSTAQSQLTGLEDGLTMERVAIPTGGATAQFTMGVDVATALTFLADKGATVSATSALFNGLDTADFSAVAADVGGGAVSNLVFNDGTDTVSFTVNHFSDYSLSVTAEQLATPVPTLTETTYSWAPVDGAVGYSVQIYNGEGPVGTPVARFPNETSIDLNTQALGLVYDDYHISVQALGDDAFFTHSAWSNPATCPPVNIKTKVTIAAKAGNPTQIINNGNTALFYFTISGTGISIEGDLNSDLKAKLPLTVGSLENVAFSGDVNAYTLGRKDNDTVEAQMSISSTAASTEIGSFAVTLSVGGSLASTHVVGTPGTVSVTDIDIIDPPPSAAPSQDDITVTRTSTTQINVTVANLPASANVRVYASASGGLPLGNGMAMGDSVTISGLTVNSDVPAIYVSKQDDFNHTESSRTEVTLGTYLTSIDPSGNYSFPALPEGYAAGGQHTQTFAISNAGTAALEGVSVALSGVDAGAFEITQPADTIAAEGGTSFTVKAKDGLGIDTYTATVTVSTDFMADKTFSVTQQVAEIPPLSAPAGIGVSGTTVSWGAVANATGYTVTVKKDGVDVEGIVNIANASTDFDLSGRSLIGGTNYTVTVKANGDGSNYVDSSWSTSDAVTVPPLQLEAPTNLDIAGTIVSWDAVDHAEGYLVTVKKGEANVPGLIDEIIMLTEFDLAGRGLPGGDYTVVVKTAGDATVTVDSTNSAPSNPVTLPPLKLATPAGLSIVGTEAQWDAVDGATGCEITVKKIVGPGDDIELGSVVTDETAYDLITFAEHQDCVAGEHTVNLMAKGDGVAYADSDPTSGSVTLTPKTPKLAAPDVTISRTSSTKANVTVAGLVEGDVVRIYAGAAGGESVNAATVEAGETSAQFTDVTVTSAAGSLYFTNTTGTRTESARVQKTYPQYVQPTGEDDTYTPSPAPKPAPVIEGDTADVSGSSTVTTSTNTDGTSTTTVAVDQSAIEQALSTGSDVNQVVVKITGTAQEQATTMSAQSFTTMTEKQADLVIETEKANLSIPPQVVNVQALSEALNVAADQIQVKVSVQEVSAAEADNLKSKIAILDENLQPVGSILQLNIEATAGGKSVKIDTFGDHKVTGEIPFSPEAIQGDVRKLCVYRFNETTGTWEPVPSRVDAATGKVTFFTDHFSNYTIMSLDKTFSDLAGHWAKEDVELMASRWVVKGDTATTYAPERNVTRAEFAALLVRALGLKEKSVTASTFSDVATTAWCSGSVEAAAAAGIVSGIGNGAFAPEASITREEMAAMVVRAMGVAGSPVSLSSGEATAMLGAFADQATIDAWASDDLAKAVKSGIVQGVSSTEVAPLASATRAEAATMVKRLMEKAGLL